MIFLVLFTYFIEKYLDFKMEYTFSLMLRPRAAEESILHIIKRFIIKL